ncbi:hypothetical protein HII31_10032, partial [Pseudocercospora fuligena]
TTKKTGERLAEESCDVISYRQLVKQTQWTVLAFLFLSAFNANCRSNSWFPDRYPYGISLARNQSCDVAKISVRMLGAPADTSQAIGNAIPF